MRLTISVSSAEAKIIITKGLGCKKELTLHIPFTFIDDKSKTSALALSISYYAYTFDSPVHLKFFT